MTDRSTEPLIVDRFLPWYDARIDEHLIVAADPMSTWRAAYDLDFLDVHTPLLDAAFWVRALPNRIRRVPGTALPELRLSGDGGLGLPGWLLLGTEPGRELAFGGVGKVWQGSIEWRDVPAEEFRVFAEPGFAKMACSFTTLAYGQGETLLTYECRTATTDQISHRAFGRYWALIRPFVGHIMRATLHTIAASVGNTSSREVGATP